MIESYFSRPETIDRLRSGPLGADLDDLATALQDEGYARDSIRHYLRGCDQFGRWVFQQGYAVADVSQTLVTRYINGLQRPTSGRFPKGAEGLSHLLKLWRQQKRLSDAINESPRTEIDQWLLRYEAYLVQVRGVAASTRRHYLRFARRFLTACFGAAPPVWSSLQAQQVSNFVQQEAATKRGHGRKLPSTAIRSFLRFLVLSGELTPGLEAVALSPRQWRHDTIPQSLTVQEIDEVLALYSGQTPMDLRNRAILTLLARLGLRAYEVASLRLEDINWHEAMSSSAPGRPDMNAFYRCRKKWAALYPIIYAGGVPKPQAELCFSTATRRFGLSPIPAPSVRLQREPWFGRASRVIPVWALISSAIPPPRT